MQELRRREYADLPLLRSGLVTNGLRRDHMEKAALADVDVCHLELEDGVRPERKAEGRETVARALQELDWSNKLTLVRITRFPDGYSNDDIEIVSAGRPTAFLLGKCQGPEDVRHVERMIARAEGKHNLPEGSIGIFCMIERASALQRVEEIAEISPYMMGMFLGPGDLGNDLGYSYGDLPTAAYASRVILAAHSTGLIALGATTATYTNLDETFLLARKCFQFGFDACVGFSPRQLPEINRAYTPSEAQLAYAEKMVSDMEEIFKEGLGAKARGDGFMLDEPFLPRARRVLARAALWGTVQNNDLPNESAQIQKSK